jgi:hypothetical protein
MSQDQNAGQDNNIKEGNTYFGTLEHFTYFRTTLVNQIPFMKKLKAD